MDKAGRNTDEKGGVDVELDDGLDYIEIKR